MEVYGALGLNREMLDVFNRFRLKAREALMVATVEQEREVSARLRQPWTSASW